MDKAQDLDQFYTNQHLASNLIDYLISRYGPDFSNSTILEPSAGEGAFTDYLQDKAISFLALDLDPKKSYIKQQDFLLWEPPANKVYFSIGNPPFGKNSSLAIKFFNKCAEFSTHIAFIIPNTFKKNSVKDKLDLNFHLTHEVNLPLSSFTHKGKPYSVPCCFQVWEKRSILRKLTPKYSTEDFDFVLPLQADLAFQRVGAKAGKITLAPEAKLKNTSSHFFIKFKDKSFLNEFIKFDFTKYKYATAGNPSISKQEILEIWNTK